MAINKRAWFCTCKTSKYFFSLVPVGVSGNDDHLIVVDTDTTQLFKELSETASRDSSFDSNEDCPLLEEGKNALTLHWCMDFEW